MGQEGYFRVEPRIECVDVRVAGELASCCGVNLAFAASGLGVVSQVENQTQLCE